MNETVFDRAVCFAVEAHKGQLRKDGATYILHPLEDATIVATMTNDLEILAAAVLHDTVEDTDVTPEQILEQFGPRVYELVMHETEDKRPTVPPAQTWQIRKEETLQTLAQSTDIAVKMLWLGDKLSNIRAFRRQYFLKGEVFFNQFNNTDPKDHAWYYGTVLQLLHELSEYPAYQEYEKLYHELFDKYLTGKGE